MNSKVNEIVREFRIPDGEVTTEPYGNGHINSTFLVTVRMQEGVRRYIMQRVNRYVFKKPEEVIRNIEKVTRYLGDVIR